LRANPLRSRSFFGRGHPPLEPHRVGARGELVTVQPVRPLLDRRLVIVTGKGGTGKTTVSAALAVAAAAAGRRVLAVEVGRDEHLPRLVVPDPAPVGYAGRELLPGLVALRADPYAALAEYLSLQLRVRALVERVLRNRAFRQLMDAAPGWRELITLGKVWHLERQRLPDGRPRFDLIVVDAPATGHGLTFLDVPRVVVSAVRAGPLHRHAGEVESLVRDVERTLLLPVTLAEELPARETAELVTRARDELQVAVDRVVVNAVVAPPFPPAVPDLDLRLRRLPDLPGLPASASLAACAAHLRQRAELNAEHVERVARSTGLPCVVLPFLAEGVRGAADLLRLAAPLGAGTAEAA
jgi:anion-transporting  ArsA/GET3 family ATPase